MKVGKNGIYPRDIAREDAVMQAEGCRGGRDIVGKIAILMRKTDTLR